MRLHLLGVNGPFPESRGATSGYLLESENDLIQFDFGSGVLSALTAIVAPESLSALVVTHWHFDHTADIPVLMYRLQACNKTLPVFGPADSSSPLYRLVCKTSCFSFTEISPDHSFMLGQTEIRAFAARHPVPSVGYRVSSCGKVFCYTGDTNTLPSLSSDCRNCDLLLADGLFPSEFWSDSKPHLSAALAAHLALDSGAKRLIITHLNPFWPAHTLLEEARAVFSSVQLAHSGEVIVL